MRSECFIIGKPDLEQEAGRMQLFLDDDVHLGGLRTDTKDYDSKPTPHRAGYA